MTDLKIKTIIINQEENTLTLFLNNGKTMIKKDYTEEFVDFVLENWESNPTSVIKKMIPDYEEKLEQIKTLEELKEAVETSKILNYYEGSVYMPSVAFLTMPIDLVKKILLEEKKGKEGNLDKYVNFWRFVSLNPTSEARVNLFWFLNKYNIEINRSGLFTAYRLVLPKKNFDSTQAQFVTNNFIKVKGWKKSPKNYIVIQEDGEYSLKQKTYVLQENEVLIGNLQELYEKVGESGEIEFTDQYTKTFSIKISKPVTMDREKCDPIQENTCSRGLHVASKQWLESNMHFGTIPLKVLVNPADVVAVPKSDSYGKMRVCAYYPLSILKLEGGKIVEDDEYDEKELEIDFIDIITNYDTVNERDTGNYKLNIPKLATLSPDKIKYNLEKIKSELYKNKC